MTQNYAIDTSVLVRMASCRPRSIAESVFDTLTKLIESGSTLWVSSMTIGESYIAIQHHYAIPKGTVRETILDILEKEWLLPCDGKPVFDALRCTTGPGLIDRLIAIQGARRDMKTLTLDRKMGKLAACELLRV